MEVAEHRFRAMASEVQVIAVGPLVGWKPVAERRVLELEDRWSRFRADSDVARLNRAGGRTTAVSGDTLVLLAAMVAGWRATGGRFDPTVLPVLIDRGYRSVVDGSAGPPLPAALRSGVGLAELAVDEYAGTATMPAWVTLDPGAIGKGLAADLVAADLVAGGAAGALVSIGGDVAAVGEPPSVEGWRVVIEDPYDPGVVVAEVAVSGGGVATSSVTSRRWRAPDGTARHHLVDPDRRAEAVTDLAAVTVFAGTGWQAEVHATAALLEGACGAIRYLRERGLGGIAVDAGGRTSTTDATLVTA